MNRAVVIVSGVYPPEPFVSAQMSEAIAMELSKTENVIVLCPPISRPYGTKQIRYETPTDYKVVTLSSYVCPKSVIIGRLRESFSFGKRVAEYIRIHHSQIKAIYANTHPTFGQYLLLDEAQKYNIPVIIHIQDIYPESLTKKLGFIGKCIEPILIKYDAHKMLKATNILAISTQMKNVLDRSRNYSSNFVQVIYNWQDDTIFKNIPSIDSGCFTFMFVGSINPTASVDTIIRAFGNAGIANSKLVVAGDGNEKCHCIEIASKFPRSNIEFVSVTPEQVPYVQAQADVLILSLKKRISETALPSKLPAYMFSAKPIIACVEDVSDIGKIILDNGCGWVVAPEDISMLSKQMKICYDTDKNTLRTMGLAGNRYALTNFSKRINLKKICNIISKL